MKKILGILTLLIVVCIATTWLARDEELAKEGHYFQSIKASSFLKPYNIENLIRRTSLFGVISIGVAFVIITGGIDLSIGSLICLVGCGLPWMLTTKGVPLPTALAITATVSLALGLSHGLLITQLRLQPFVVTLCGLLLYRGLARGFTGDQTQGFQTGFQSLRWLATGKIPLPGFGGFGIPVPCLILLAVAVAAAVFLNKTIYGRYLLALGRNEQAARYSGINTNAMIILAYVICAAMAGLGGMLFVLDVNSAQPVDFGNFYELYAVAAAVLGGCSLRGGEGSIVGVVIGTALMQVLRNMINLAGLPTHIEFAVIGGVILVGVSVDEWVKLYAARKRAASDQT
ncbi:MAG: ABC transporter permease [Pedosphaera sp.]|nr:ABC transporter permease [Pedosphaera sp.]